MFSIVLFCKLLAKDKPHKAGEMSSKWGGGQGEGLIVGVNHMWKACTNDNGDRKAS